MSGCRCLLRRQDFLSVALQYLLIVCRDFDQSGLVSSHTKPLQGPFTHITLTYIYVCTYVGAYRPVQPLYRPMQKCMMTSTSSTPNTLTLQLSGDAGRLGIRIVTALAYRIAGWLRRTEERCWVSSTSESPSCFLHHSAVFLCRTYFVLVLYIAITV